MTFGDQKMEAREPSLAWFLGEMNSFISQPLQEEVKTPKHPLDQLMRKIKMIDQYKTIVIQTPSLEKITGYMGGISSGQQKALQQFIETTAWNQVLHKGVCAKEGRQVLGNLITVSPAWCAADRCQVWRVRAHDEKKCEQRPANLPPSCYTKLCCLVRIECCCQLSSICHL